METRAAVAFQRQGVEGRKPFRTAWFLLLTPLRHLRPPQVLEETCNYVPVQATFRTFQFLVLLLGAIDSGGSDGIGGGCKRGVAGGGGALRHEGIEEQQSPSLMPSSHALFPPRGPVDEVGTSKGTSSTTINSSMVTAGEMPEPSAPSFLGVA